MNPDSNSVLPLWLLHEDELEAWRAGQAPSVRRWLIEQSFKAEKHRVMLLPGADGAVAGAVAGLGKRLGNCRCGTRRDWPKNCPRIVIGSRKF